MKPEISIIPEPDHSTEDRSVSQAMKARVREEQGGNCARSWCEAPALDVDHIIALWNGGNNDRTNLEALCTACHGQKTKAEAALRAKADRQGGFKGQAARRQKNGSKLKSRGFDKTRSKGFDGKVRPAKSLRKEAGK